MGLILASYLGLYGILIGLTKSTDHPSICRCPEARAQGDGHAREVGCCSALQEWSRRGFLGASCVPFKGLLFKGIWGFPKILGPFVIVLIIRALLFWGPYWGPLFLDTPNMGPFKGYVRPCWGPFWALGVPMCPWILVGSVLWAPVLYMVYCWCFRGSKLVAHTKGPYECRWKDVAAVGPS